MFDPTHKSNTSIKPLLLGLILSTLLLLAVYFITTQHALAGWGFILTVIALTTFQAGVQIISFLRLSTEPKPRWNSIMFFLMILIVIIVIGGSLWIMANLSYNEMIPNEGLSF